MQEKEVHSYLAEEEIDTFNRQGTLASMSLYPMPDPPYALPSP